MADASVDVVTVAFGVRNFGDLAAGLRESVAGDEARGQSRYPGVLAAPQPGVPGAVRVLPYKILPRIGGSVSRDKKGLRVSAGFGGEFPPGGVSGDDGKGGVPELPGEEPELRDRADIYRRAMRKFLLYLLLPGCCCVGGFVPQGRREGQRNIRFGGIEKIERQGADRRRDRRAGDEQHGLQVAARNG